MEAATNLRALSKRNRPGTTLIAVVGAILALHSPAHADKSPYDWAFVKLDYARKEKVQQLRGFCDKIHSLAGKAAQDEVVLACFDINLKYARATAEGGVPEELTTRVAELRGRFNRYYIENYLAFYDILFVDKQGGVFYTIRKERDFGHNLLQDDAETSPLVQCLKTMPHEEVFVDFHHYGPSSETAAFIIEPVENDGSLVGWIILQCAVSKLNTILAWTEELGETGETFLVNQDGFMLTESNFEGSSTILRKRLDDRNVQAKFTELQGHRMVRDYRGCNALTSFEVVEFLNTRWLVVAKVDRHEVITQHYAQHRRYFGDKLLAQLARLPVPPVREMERPEAAATMRVDMDEFLKAEKGEVLHTFGVSTCTGLLVTYPGRFAYLAHVSPKDKVYGADETNLAGQMIKQVKTFDAYPCDMRHITFVIVAPHLNSVLPITDKLIEEGFLLSQVRVLHDPQATSAAITYDCREDHLRVEWRLPTGQNRGRVHWLEDAVNLETIVQAIMDQEEQLAANGAERVVALANRQDELADEESP